MGFKTGNRLDINNYPDLVDRANEETGSIINDFKLYQNYPNPFNTDTIIKYDIKTKSNVQLTIYDLKGREIEAHALKNQSIGEHSYKFNASRLASGIYIYKLKADLYEQSRKMLLLR